MSCSCSPLILSLAPPLPREYPPVPSSASSVLGHHRHAGKPRCVSRRHSFVICVDAEKRHSELKPGPVVIVLALFCSPVLVSGFRVQAAVLLTPENPPLGRLGIGHLLAVERFRRERSQTVKAAPLFGDGGRRCGRIPYHGWWGGGW